MAPGSRPRPQSRMYVNAHLTSRLKDSVAPLTLKMPTKLSVLLPESDAVSNLFRSEGGRHLSSQASPFQPSPPPSTNLSNPPLLSFLLPGRPNNANHGQRGFLGTQASREHKRQILNTGSFESKPLLGFPQLIRNQCAPTGGRRRVTVSVRLSCLSCSPRLPKQTLISHSQIYTPNAYSNAPIDFLVASHYQDLLIAPAPH